MRLISRTDYEALAEALGTSATVDEATGKIATLIGDDAPDFDHDRFYAAVVAARTRAMRGEQAIRYEGRHSTGT